MDTEALKKSLLVKFVEVTQDRLQAIQLGILDLEKPESNAAAEGVARELHTMKGEAYLKIWVMPNLFFHVTNAYAILRHNGVEIGKRDFLRGANA